MLLKGAYCVGEHFVDPQCILGATNSSLYEANRLSGLQNSLYIADMLEAKIISLGSRVNDVDKLCGLFSQTISYFEFTRDDQKAIGPLYFGLPGNENAHYFSIYRPSKQCT